MFNFGLGCPLPSKTNKQNIPKNDLLLCDDVYSEFVNQFVEFLALSMKISEQKWI